MQSSLIDKSYEAIKELVIKSSNYDMLIHRCPFFIITPYITVLISYLMVKFLELFQILYSKL